MTANRVLVICVVGIVVLSLIALAPLTGFGGGWSALVTVVRLVAGVAVVALVVWFVRTLFRAPSTGGVVLVPMSTDDEWLTGSMETDPAMMRELGGPIDPAEVPALHARRLRGIADGTTWFFTVRLGADGPAVGSVCIWTGEPGQEPGHSEAGWMIRPEYQGRGIAGEAVREMVERAKADGRWGELHAFPGMTDAASNAVAKRAGFTLVGQVDVEFRGQPLRCNDWMLRT